MNKVTVTLGGTEYQINELSLRHARMWREKFSEPIQAILGLLRHAQTEVVDDNLRLNMGAVGVLLSGTELVLKSPDTLADALFAYAPNLEAERDTIEETATTNEILAALWEVVTKLAYPFGSILTRLQSGL